MERRNCSSFLRLRVLFVSVLVLLLSGLVDCDSPSTIPTNVDSSSTQSLPSTINPVSSGTSSSYSSSTLQTPLPSSGTETSSTALPSQSVSSSEIDTILERRLTYITRAVNFTTLPLIPAWVSSLGTDGAWPASEVDYTTGCAAQRANWPAENHWIRLMTMAAAWHGGIPTPGGDQYVQNATVLSAISLGMDYWFNNDFTDPDCIDSGGLPACPCGTPGLWNTNWFSSIILIPKLVGPTCLIMNSTLTAAQQQSCTTMLARTYAQFFRTVNGLGAITGANTLDIASVGIDLGLLNTNISVMTDCYQRVHNEVVIEDIDMADGIRRDGSFGQHVGVLYNGNYGKDYANDVLALEVSAAGTPFSAAANSRTAFATLMDGDEWMIFRNTLTDVLHWDFSVLGRFISFPVADNQPTSSILLNISDVQVLGQLWGSDVLTGFGVDANTSGPNYGDIRGNRMFYDNDYMVHRGADYVTTIKMFSNRTQNTECVNAANPLGFHLSDGVMYTHVTGNEYEDIAASWDWNLIPGITTDYGSTPLDCAHAKTVGLEAFVGGVSDGTVGVAVMRYTNPLVTSFSWQKAWFFLEDDIQVVVLSNLSSPTATSQVRSVLDQKRRDGDYYINGVLQNDTTFSKKRHVNHRTAHHGHSSMVQIGSSTAEVSSLWHGGVGYTFDYLPSPLSLSVQTGNVTGNWSILGTSTQPPTTVDLFAAWIDQPTSDTFAYSVYPGTTHTKFEKKALKPKHQVIANDSHVSAVYDEKRKMVLVVFWDADGGSLTVPPEVMKGRSPPITLSADGNSAIIYRIDTGNVTVSDPSQTKQILNVALAKEGEVENLIFELPVNASGLAGMSVSQVVSWDCDEY